MKCANAAEAVSVIESGQRVFLHGAMATPLPLVEALVDQADRLRDVELIHLHTAGPARYADPRYAASFRVVNLFVGPNVRRAFDHDRVDYLPCFLSEIPALLRSRRRPIDVALIQVSPPDRHGLCTLGTSVDVTHAAVEVARTVIAQVNPRMPRVHGDGGLPARPLRPVGRARGGAARGAAGAARRRRARDRPPRRVAGRGRRDPAGRDRRDPRGRAGRAPPPPPPRHPHRDVVRRRARPDRVRRGRQLAQGGPPGHGRSAASSWAPAACTTSSTTTRR